MAKNPANFLNAVVDTDYLYGTPSDETVLGANDGTPVNRVLISDIIETFAQAMNEASIVYNDQFDNQTNGHQYLDAFKALFAPSASFLPLTGGTLTGNLTLENSDIIMNDNFPSINAFGKQIGSDFSLQFYKPSDAVPRNRIVLGYLSDANIAFFTGDGVTSAIERMVVSEDGNIGINKTDPTTLLNISGQGEFIRLDFPDNQQGFIRGVQNNVNAWFLGYASTSDVNLSLSNQKNAGIRFATNNLIQMSLLNNGVLRMGNNNWSAPTGGVHLSEDGQNNGLSFYDGADTSARIYRNSNNLYIGARAGQDNNGIRIDQNGVCYFLDSISIGRIDDDTGWISTSNYGSTQALVIDNPGGGNANVYHNLTNLCKLGTSAKKWSEVWAVDGSINTSDERVKKNKKVLENALEKIEQISGYTYLKHADLDENEAKAQYTAEPKQSCGLLAQEVYKILPEAVYKPENEKEETWAMNYARLSALYVQAIKELHEKVKALEALK